MHVVLYAHKEFADMSKEDRIRACYQHACLKYASNSVMTNASLRERFKIAAKNYPMISRVINDTIEANLIIKSDESLSKRYTKYLPFYA